MIRWLILGGIALLVGGIWLFGELNQANRDATGEVISAGDESVLDLQQGDCVLDLGLDSADGDVTDASVRVVPCEEPHVYQVFAVDPRAFSDFDNPAISAFQEQGDEYCFSAFSIFTGQNLEFSELTYTYLYPTEESWRQGDRELTCVLHYENYAPWQGSARN